MCWWMWTDRAEGRLLSQHFYVNTRSSDVSALHMWPFWWSWWGDILWISPHVNQKVPSAAIRGRKFTSSEISRRHLLIDWLNEGIDSMNGARLWYSQHGREDRSLDSCSFEDWQFSPYVCVCVCVYVCMCVCVFAEKPHSLFLTYNLPC